MKKTSEDDLIASLMEEMGQRQGYDDATDDNTNDTARSRDIAVNTKGGPSSAVFTPSYNSYPRLLPELSDYPANSNYYCPGNHSIWNPLVQGGGGGGEQQLHQPNDDGATNAMLCLLPTNPKIELLRRRVYEKFRRDVQIMLQDMIERCQLLPTTTITNDSSATSSSSSKSFSKNKKKTRNKLPIPSMLDKWHMDAKLEERTYILKKQEKQQRQQKGTEDNDEASLVLSSTSTTEIFREYRKRKQYTKEGGEYVYYYDPVLFNKQAPTIFVEKILKPNIEKLWNKQSKRKMNDPPVRADKVSSAAEARTKKEVLPQQQRTQQHVLLLGPPKFHKKLKTVQKGLYRLVCEALDAFDTAWYNEVRHESLRSTTSSTSGNKRHHKHNTSSTPKIDTGTTSSVGGLENNDAEDDKYDAAPLVRVTYSGVTFKLHAAYYEKLQRLYDRTRIKQQQLQQRQQIYSNTTTPRRRRQLVVGLLSFEEAIFCLLCRYDMIQGSGLQAGVPGSVMDVLLVPTPTILSQEQQQPPSWPPSWPPSCTMECFASPLNCRYDSYASAFYDVDQYFGSIGSFFDLSTTTFFHNNRTTNTNTTDTDTNTNTNNGNGNEDGSDSGGVCYQANPPFCDGLILQLNDKINDILASSSSSSGKPKKKQDRRPIMFVVFVPAWYESDCYQALLQNKYLVQHTVLKQGQHYYAEGTQHRRRDSFRVASFDTSIFVYQNDKAKQKQQQLCTPQQQQQQQKRNDEEEINGNNNKNNNNDNITILDKLKNAFCQDPGTMQKQNIEQTHTTTRTTTFIPPLALPPKNPPLSSSSPRPPSSFHPASDATDAFMIKNDSNTPRSRQKNGKTKEKEENENDIGNNNAAKKERKRKWNQREEGTAQLNLLESLGLSLSSSFSKKTELAAAVTETKVLLPQQQRNGQTSSILDDDNFRHGDSNNKLRKSNHEQKVTNKRTKKTKKKRRR